MNGKGYICPKCQNTQYETGEYRAAGWSSIAGMGLFFLGALLRLKFD